MIASNASVISSLAPGVLLHVMLLSMSAVVSYSWCGVVPSCSSVKLCEKDVDGRQYLSKDDLSVVLNAVCS